jgi:hypothetical protein
MTNLLSRLAWLLLLLGASAVAARGQDSTAAPSPVDPECRRVFDDVETGIREGRPEAFVQHFGPQVQIHLRGFEGGYVSSAQAYYVLEDFFQGRRPVGVRLTTFGDTGGTPYASGSAVFNARGNRESAQIYVSLTRLQGRWTVGQLNIR